MGHTRPRNTKEAHVAFPGGRSEDGDEGGLYTAMRQTWEEIGIDLAENDYTLVGQLDDREITTSLGKRLLMILSPFVFLQLTPSPPPPDPSPSTSLIWVPLDLLVTRTQRRKWSNVTVDAASRLAPRHSLFLRYLVRILVGTMQFPAILLDETFRSSSIEGRMEKGTAPNSPQQLKLWGLSLGMTLDLIAHMIPITKNDSPLRLQLPYPITDEHGDAMGIDIVAPSLASVFPKFSYPDVNFWIWVFGKRYREVVRGWEASVRADGTNDRRINWSGSALSTFYAAVRKALLVVIVARGLGVLVALAFAAWWALNM
jgi:8-oxo-dGTP pyrophosphatase MutT (NUDIX family)